MIPLSVVDAFTDTPFRGNPAAVCLLDSWPSNEWLQLVGREMNLAETAFLRHRPGGEYELRWFTPTVEVALCGHATLASAHVLWESGAATQDVLTFATNKSGILTARRLPSGEIELDFPAQPATPCATPAGLLESLGANAIAVARNESDYLVEVATEAEVRALTPDLTRLARIECRGVIVTAKSDDARYDFVSRFFAPQSGIDEDPVTGSAHCCLAVWWGNKLNKVEMTGYQASTRGGVVRVVRAGDRVKLIGRAITISRGQLLALPM
ncbi:PhzF family phenazine biosynthesis protein [Gemmata sp. G18]|uniref:PhzF family phenazine biosynthesis protein n=1 Tax=Gemmata palustris TaxID=2822762 RepID=A0ABS5BJN7_9BACT|nr:PhzF family phenazine biosynthesis protein [Gemmata palustris]MBP3953921.1 PhzF family phenazine biosynthesis protein [Gemmata palustris]